MRELDFILNSILSLVVGAFLVRLLLQYVRTDLRNPLAQAVLKVTSPVVVPLRRILPPIGRLDTATALATLDVLATQGLVERAERIGSWLRTELLALGVEVRGRGMMIAIDLGGVAGGGLALQRALLRRGYITSTGGGQRDVLVLTPPLTIAEALLRGFVAVLGEELGQLRAKP